MPARVSLILFLLLLRCMLQLLGSKFIMDSGVSTVPQAVCPDSECGRAVKCVHCARALQVREGSQVLCSLHDISNLPPTAAAVTLCGF